MTTLNKIIDIIDTLKKGAYCTIEYITNKSKKNGPLVEKKTTRTFRTGVTYANMKINANKVTGPLPWGHWVANYENYLIEHKGKYYLRVTNSFNHTSKTNWLLNGKEVDGQELVNQRLINEKELMDDMIVKVIPIDNIIKIGAIAL